MAKRTTTKPRRPRNALTTPALKQVQTHAEASEAHVSYLVSTIVAAAKEAETPPAIAVLGAGEFIALMILTNITPAQREEEIASVAAYIRDRLRELDAPTH